MTESTEYTERLREALRGQLAPSATDGHGTRILFRCRACAHPWLRDGAQSFPRLSPEQLARYAEELHADPDALPTATCPICGATLAQMEIELEGYHDRAGELWGVGLSYEGLEPPGAHLLVGAFNMVWLEREQRAGRDPAAGVNVNFARTRAFLTWLTTLSYPTEGYHSITSVESALMAHDNPPGHGATGTENWQWKGGSWTFSIPPLGGRCALNVGQAMPPNEPYSLSATIALTRLLARITPQGHIAGEPE